MDTPFYLGLFAIAVGALIFWKHDDIAEFLPFGSERVSWWAWWIGGVGWVIAGIAMVIDGL
ncbi:MAG TPA: hypothetical protein VNC78_12155 [Actinomycetota bacterium]|nr:hypothetical protein [Actinomycetota bacterium]